MKAKISGYNLLIPNRGMAPILFLEWLRDNNRHNELLHKIWHDSPDHEGYFIIRLNNHISSTTKDCMKYINSNL